MGIQDSVHLVQQDNNCDNNHYTIDYEYSGMFSVYICRTIAYDHNNELLIVIHMHTL